MKFLLFPIFLAFTAMATTQPLYCAEPCHITEATRLLIKQGLKLNRELGFNILGYGGSCAKEIKQLEFIVEMPWKPPLSDARMIFVGILYEWIKEVNDDDKARPYYSNDPMIPENFELRMLLGNFDVSSSKLEPKVSFIFNIGEKIVYCYRDENTGKLTPFLRENYYQVLDSAKSHYQEEKN